MTVLTIAMVAAVAVDLGTGWRNVCETRRETPPVNVVWTAPADGFTVEREDGAEGEVEFGGGTVTVRKTNAAGRIVVTAPPFRAEKGRRLRFFADVSVRSDNPWSAGFLCAWSSKRRIVKDDAIAAPWFFGGGYYMTCLINSAPGMTYRKYRHLDPDADEATAAIVVSGAPSTTVWRNLAAEDLAAADAAWDERYRRRTERCDHSADMQPRDAFLRTLAAEKDHTAAIETRDGVSRLVIDGAPVPPVAYKISTLVKPGAVTYAGKRLQDRAGVNIGVMNLRLADLKDPERGFWTEKGFDAKAAADFLEGPMRVGEKTLFVLAIGTSAYPAFTEKEHPEDAWLNEDGSVARGNSGSIIPDKYNDGGAKDPGDRRWPWVSMAAPSWRAAIKRCTGELFAELRRRGMLKRIIGVHYYGYHDGQLSLPIPDHSPHVKAAYADYLAKKGLKETDPAGSYAYFSKQVGFLALEDFSREAKRLAGKPILAVKWNQSPFHVSFDLTSFVNSDVVDVLVPQAAYHYRLPGMSQGLDATAASYHLHGKMLWMEFDLRTYKALDVWARSVIWSKGLNTAEDFPMWQTTLRKNAGMINACRMGWWMYDMAAGWYDDDEIADDFGEVMAQCRELAARRPDPWRPDVALVVDELAIANYNTPNGPKVEVPVTLTAVQWWKNACSGVPYESYLAQDVYDRPELLDGRKAVLLVGYVSPSDAQKAFMASLEKKGVKTLVFRPWGVPPREINDFARKAGAFVAAAPDVLEVDMNGDFLSLHCLVPGRHRVKLPFAAKVVNMKDGCAAECDELELDLTAGETRWYRLYRR